MILGIAISGAQADDYLGEFCWRATDRTVMKLFVRDFGAGYFTVVGSIIEEEEVIVTGSAKLGPEDVVLTLIASKDIQCWTGGRICYADVSLPDFNCTLKCIAVGNTSEEDSTPEIETKYYEKKWFQYLVPSNSYQ